MALKKFQPERPDFLINTDWGIPKEQLSSEAAKSRGMKLFHKRWVIKEEKNRLREEYSTYHSIRNIGYLLIVLSFVVFISIADILKGGILSSFFTILYGLVMLTGGIGLIKYRRFARNIAVFVFLSFLFLPFTPLLSDDKGSPLIIILGLIGLYYLLRRTARKIFAPFSKEHTDNTKHKSSVVHKAIYVLLFFSIFVIYTIYDMSQAERMAADVCNRAVKGMLLEDFLSAFSEKDYKIIKRPDYTIIVPKKGMGRNHCTVSHDGQKIIGSKTGFTD